MESNETGIYTTRAAAFRSNKHLGGGEYLFQQRLCAQVEVIIHPARTGSVIAALGGDPAGPL